MGMEQVVLLILLVFTTAVCACELHNRQQRKKLAKMEEQCAENERLVEELADYNCLLNQYREQLSAMDMEAGEAGREVTPVTGHALLDALLSRKREQAERAGIRFLVECDPPVRWSMGERETAALWMNLLDNAIESAGTCENGEIRICIREEQGLLLRIENSRRPGALREKEPRGSWTPDGSRVQQSGEFATTKENAKAHGFGLGVVRQLTAGCGGQLLVQEQEERFLVEIRL